MYGRRQILEMMVRSAVAAGATMLVGGGVLAQHIAPAARKDFGALAARFNGEILLPTSEKYDAARRTFSFNPRTDRRPALIARCKDEQDVVTALEFARSNGLEIAVRSGGHDVLAASTCDEGIVIDLRGLDGVRLDADNAHVVTGPGATAGAIDSAAAKLDRLVPLGCNAQVGVAGLTLGGGLGWFMGRHGATCDNLRRARVVTADGQILTASQDENPELLWALRGGGGNFGVVVELELASHPVEPVTGGFLCFDGAQLPEFLRFYRDYMADAPDALTVEVLVMAPARRVIFVMASFLGDPAEAQRALAPLRTFAAPLADGLRTAPYPGVMSPTNEVGALFRPDPDAPKEPQDAPGIQWLGGSLGELSDAAIATIVEHLELAEGGWAFNIGHHLHGAVCRTSPGASPLPRPCGAFTYHFDAWWGSAMSAPARMAWVDAAVAAMRRHETAAYINYLSDDRPESVCRSYGASYPRLQAIKRRYDPDNVFHRNRNILG